MKYGKLRKTCGNIGITVNMRIWRAELTRNEMKKLIQRSTIYMRDYHRIDNCYQWQIGNFLLRMQTGEKEED